jgi:hypothetical protein
MLLVYKRNKDKPRPEYPGYLPAHPVQPIYSGNNGKDMITEHHIKHDININAEVYQYIDKVVQAEVEKRIEKYVDINKNSTKDIFIHHKEGNGGAETEGDTDYEINPHLRGVMYKTMNPPASWKRFHDEKNPYINAVRMEYTELIDAIKEGDAIKIQHELEDIAAAALMGIDTMHR